MIFNDIVFFLFRLHLLSSFPSLTHAISLSFNFTFSLPSFLSPTGISVAEVERASSELWDQVADGKNYLILFYSICLFYYWLIRFGLGLTLTQHYSITSFHYLPPPPHSPTSFYSFHYLFSTSFRHSFKYRRCDSIRTINVSSRIDFGYVSFRCIP